MLAFAWSFWKNSAGVDRVRVEESCGAGRQSACEIGELDGLNQERVGWNESMGRPWYTRQTRSNGETETHAGSQ